VKQLKDAIRREEISAISDILVENQLGVDAPMPDCDDTPLVFASGAGRFASCQHLIDRHGASILARNRFGRTALMEMIRCRGSNWPKAIAELLTQSVNEQDGSGKTALMFASSGAGAFGSKRGSLAIIRQLVAFGADLALVNNRGQTAVGVAEMENAKSAASANEEVVEFLKAVSIEQRAMKNLRSKYRCSFDSNGVLILAPAS